MIEMDFIGARQRMIVHQIRANRVNDPLVIRAIMTLPREAFTPKVMRGITYHDENLAIGDERYLMEPMVLARLLQLARVKPVDTALSIGCGTGYAAAVLARIVATVIAIESDYNLAKAASITLEDQGINNAKVIVTTITGGYPSQAPYDVILFDGAINITIPETICNQLAEDGRLVSMVRDGHLATATLIQRKSNTFSRHLEFEASIKDLPGFQEIQGFSF